MPETWEEYGDGGDVNDPAAAIPAQGRYMGELREMMEDHAHDEEELLDMSLAAYYAGPGALEDYDHNLKDILTDYSETRDYISSIRAHTTTPNPTPGSTPTTKTPATTPKFPEPTDSSCHDDHAAGREHLRAPRP